MIVGSYGRVIVHCFIEPVGSIENGSKIAGALSTIASHLPKKWQIGQCKGIPMRCTCATASRHPPLHGYGGWYLGQDPSVWTGSFNCICVIWWLAIEMRRVGGDWNWIVSFGMEKNKDTFFTKSVPSLDKIFGRTPPTIFHIRYYGNLLAGFGSW